MRVRLDHGAVGVSGWEQANAFWHDLLGAELEALPRGSCAYRFR